MNQQPFWLSGRKWAYAIAAVAILIAIHFLSRPSSGLDEGGVLAQMRRESHISEADLGKIDPASSTIKLATLGLNSVAQSMLWNMADEFKKKEDWTNLTVTLETLAKLNPNMISLWKFQSWNLSYNVSVQFDDYRDRYYYVRRGIEYLDEGIEYNRENRDIPQLLWDKGWFVGQKIGRADEHVQYRRLFKADDEFHGDKRPPGSELRDNWLVSKVEFQNCVDAIDIRKKSIGKKSEKIVYSSPAKSQMSYAEAIEEEGSFETGQQAWAISADDWREFGDRQIEHSTGRILRLGHEAQLVEAITQLEQQLDQLSPGLREKIYQERLAKLSDQQRAAVEKPFAERTVEESQLAYEVEPGLNVTDHDVYNRLVEEDPNNRIEAGRIVNRLVDTRLDLNYTQRYKQDANYDYWALRAEFEQTDTAVEARRKMFEAKQALRNQDDDTAVKLYEEGFLLWKEVLDRFPDLRDPDGTTGDDLMVFVKDYRRALDLHNREIPNDFPLWDIIINFDLEQEFTEEIDQHQRWLLEQQRAKPGEESPADDGPSPTPAEPEPAAPEPAAPATSDEPTEAPTPAEGENSGEESPPATESGETPPPAEQPETGPDTAPSAEEPSSTEEPPVAGEPESPAEPAPQNEPPADDPS